MVWWAESSALKADAPGDLREELPLVNRKAQWRTSEGWTEQLRTRRKEEEVAEVVTGTLLHQRRSESRWKDRGFCPLQPNLRGEGGDFPEVKGALDSRKSTALLSLAADDYMCRSRWILSQGCPLEGDP